MRNTGQLSAMHKQHFYIVNAVTAYRLVMAPVLVVLVVNNQFNLFRWLLVVSFFTDAIDGFFSRKYHVDSVFGARLDSLADDLTIAAALAGALQCYPAFIKEQLIWIALLGGLFLLQASLALIRYGRMTSFHTRMAKLASIAQGIFFLLLFFLDYLPYGMFYMAVAITGIDLAEEIILVLVLPHWKTDVKGLYEVWKEKKTVQ